MELDFDDPIGHVVKPRFGLDEQAQARLDKITTFISEFEETTDSITARLLLREAYLDAYNIFKKNTPRHPLQLVAVLPKENVVVGSAFDLVLQRFLYYNVYKYTGLSFDRFINLPRHVTEMIFSRIVTLQEKQSPMLDNLGRELQNLDKRR